jgi:uncharacterized protein YqjF (DUF2071 family)
MESSRPVRAPVRWPLMHQQWLHLLFLHWPVPPNEVQRLLPRGLAVDTFDGTAYVGLVPFTMRGVRPSGLPPLPALSRFHEVNLRTYVRREGEEPGVFFFSLDAASRLTVLGARLFYRLPYHFARMRMTFEHANGKGPAFGIRYYSDRMWPSPAPARCALRYSPQGEDLGSAAPATLDYFLIERYVLYSSSRGVTRQARVSHAPYPLRRARVEGLEETLSEAAGLPGPAADRIVHYSPGVSVRVSAPVRLSGDER